MKKIVRIAVLLLCIAAVLAPQASALVPYTTYTYDIDGNYVDSPHAYVPDKLISSATIGLGEVGLSSPSDLETDAEENVYIADPTNNRIVILNKDYTLNTILTAFVNGQGVPDMLEGPQGVFIREDKIYVCDSKNARIVVFTKTSDEDGRITGVRFDHTVLEPYSPVMKEGHVYTPIACAVDAAGRIYVVSSTTNEGIISMNASGEFLGFLGAQRTAPSAWQIAWRVVQTKEQRASQMSQVPTEYNNITIDESGFIFVTTSSLKESKAASAIASHSTSGDYAPVKKLNAQGEDVMMRTGFWPPSGEVTVVHYANVKGGTEGVSLVTDVALGPDGIWTICDARRQRFYTYDSRGKLLYIFGDNGPQLGNNTNLGAICYQGDTFLALDRSIDSFTVYKRTAYGDDLFAAVRNVEERNYDQSAKHWEDVLLRNSNFDEAYIGIGDSYYRAGNYEEAQKYYSYAYDAEGYSKCFAQIRKGWIEKYILVIPVVIIAIAVAVSFFLKYANKVNVKGQVMKEKRSFWEAFLYAFHVIFHPFDGFWDLKHEKRGNFKAGAFFVGLTIVGYIYNDIGQSFWYAPNSNGINIMDEILGVLVPLGLWALGNWCLTTLFEGEGTMKDILLAACYSVIPLPLMMIPATILTHVLTLDESAVISLLIGIGYVWAAFLLIIGVMTTHDYTFGKNILTVAGTLVAMVFIMFIVVLFSGLLSKIVSFAVNIFLELSLRA